MILDVSCFARYDKVTDSLLKPGKYTSISAQKFWHNWEICIKNNGFILPHHFVEVKPTKTED